MKKVEWITLILVLVSGAGAFVIYRISKRTLSDQTQLAQAAQSQLTQYAVQTQPQIAFQGEPFDKALRKVVVDLGASEFSSGKNPEHSEVRCYFYPTFVVKEMDMKELGDEWISVAPVSASNPQPCKQEHSRNEIVFKDWDGYFAGVKGNFVFLNAEDAYNGGYPFGIFDAVTGKKFYEDSRESGRDETLRFVSDGDKLVLRYPRIYPAECSVPQKKTECWEDIERKTGLNSQPIPDCTGYGGNIDETDPSVVSYPVEVDLQPSFQRRLIPGPVKCWAAD